MIVQGLFLLLFLWLFWETRSQGADYLAYPVKLFLDLDPLLAVTTLLATRTGDAFPYLSLGTMTLTVLSGRVFCGWVCPLGTIHNVIGLWNRRKTPLSHRSFLWIKYAIAIFLVVTSLFSLQLTGLVDPISFLLRSLSVSIFPLLAYVGEACLNMLSGNGSLGPRSVFLQGSLMGFLFLGILGLNLVERRFWCRYLCPLGAFLGLLSRYALVRRTISEGCNECGQCVSACPSRIPAVNGGDPAECFLCGDCDDACPCHVITYGRRRHHPTIPLDLGRRRVAGVVAFAILAVPLGKMTATRRVTYASPRLIRPPGACGEGEFLARCVKCGACMKVCPTSGLQPACFESGMEGLWSPVLVPRLGYCEYRCTLCGQVCPTGAIRRLSLAEKERVKIGLALIAKDRCLPYAFSIPCIVCQEVCPTPTKAVKLETVMITDEGGEKRAIQRPRVEPQWCVGCGICEARCPIIGEPAIYVISAGESRTPEKQFLL